MFLFGYFNLENSPPYMLRNSAFPTMELESTSQTFQNNKHSFNATLDVLFL